MANDGRGSLVNRHTLLLAALRDAETTKCDCAVLGAISEHADLNGACWPGVELLASKLSITSRSVMRAVKNLERLGYLEVDRSKRSNHYRIASTGDKEVTIEDEQQVTNPSPIGDTAVTSQVTNLSHHTCQPCHPNSVQELSSPNSVQGTQVVASVEQVTKGTTRQVTFRQWIHSKPEHEKAIPADDPIFGYATDVGIPRDFLRLCWLVFAEKYREDRKRYSDWRAVFRNAVRGNWMKLWWIDGGIYQLTTAGKQADLQFKTGIQHQQQDPGRLPKLVA